MRETQPFFINEMPITQGAASQSLGEGARGSAVIGSREEAGSRKASEVGSARGQSGAGEAGPAECAVLLDGQGSASTRTIFETEPGNWGAAV